MKMRIFWIFSFIMTLVLIGGDVLAQATAGETSIAQAKVVYCGLKGLIEGNLGLVVGLVMAFLGVWSLINGGKLMMGIVFIVAGASLTAIPGMVESTLMGFGTLLKEAKFTTTEQNISAFMCTDSNVSITGEINDFGSDPKLSDQQIKERTGECTGGYLDCL